MKTFKKVLSYVLVAALSAGLAFGAAEFLSLPGESKLDDLESLILEKFIGEKDRVKMEDAAAQAMIGALGDRWSYYISAADYQSYQENMANSYVGIGVTILRQEKEDTLEIVKVFPGSSAEEAGLQAGDRITAVEGEPISQLGVSGAQEKIRGKEGTVVTLEIQRGEDALQVQVTRKPVETPVATGKMLDDGIGYVRIHNFHTRCAEETIRILKQLQEEGAQSLILDLRFNPGGYVTELVDLLDYLLPEGDLFRSVDYRGKEEVYTSDASCVDLPMAVIVNADSYSAAEFFAAAMAEYDAAVVVGELTSGKGYFQQTYTMSDGSAVGLSVGKYFTPKGESLIGVGVQPDVELGLDEETAVKVYNEILEPKDDPQIAAAIAALKSGENP